MSDINIIFNFVFKTEEKIVSYQKTNNPSYSKIFKKRIKNLYDDYMRYPKKVEGTTQTEIEIRSESVIDLNCLKDLKPHKVKKNN